MPRGPMAKHSSARQRTNGASTAREIVLRQPGEDLLPVPELPARYEVVKVDGEDIRREVAWHSQAKVAWTELWQFPLVYQAPEVDHHLLQVYIALVDNFWDKLERGKAVTEQANQIRAFSEQWGIGEKSRRHLQVTIQEAEEAIERGRKGQTKRFENEAPSASAFTPEWTDADEDDGSLIEDAEVVE